MFAFRRLAPWRRGTARGLIQIGWSASHLEMKIRVVGHMLSGGLKRLPMLFVLVAFSNRYNWFPSRRRQISKCNFSGHVFVYHFMLLIAMRYSK